MNRIVYGRGLLCAVGVLALVGCASVAPAPLETVATDPDIRVTPTPTPTPTATGTPTPSQAGIVRPTPTPREDTEAIHLVRYIGGNESSWPDDSYTSARVDPNFGFADLYTRFVLVDEVDSVGVPSTDGGDGSNRRFRSYRNERPSWLTRLLSDEERSVVSVARIEVMNPSLALTVPIYSVSYNSGGEGGEAWATALTSSHVSSPLFRITGNSRFSLTVSTTASDATQSSGFTTAISALTNAVELVSPDAGLLTALSERDANSRAAALDTAISSLLSYSVSEEIRFGRMLTSWRPGAAIQLNGCAPFVRAEWDERRAATAPAGRRQPPAMRDNVRCADEADIGGAQNHFIGTWYLMLTCPQFSIFSSRSICASDNSLIDISTATLRKTLFGQISISVPNSLVLEEPLGENATIRSVIRGSDFFIAFVDDADPDAADYGRFCASTMDALRQQGLTGLDSALGLRATLSLMPEFVTDARNTTKMSTCTTLLADHGVALTT